MPLPRVGSPCVWILPQQAAGGFWVTPEDVRSSDPADHAARFDLAQALHASGDAAGAVAELLELFRRDREWNDGAAKAQLFTIFDAPQPSDPVVLEGRRKLSSMIFA